MTGRAGLSLNQAPPLSVPLRFFLSAPLFGILAALLLCWYGPEAITSRWSNITLAITHLMTLGYLAMTIFGAMMQMLPVMVGSHISRPRVVGAALHVLLCLGLITLVCGFLLINTALIQIGMLLLALDFVLFLIVAGNSLLRVPTVTATVTGMRVATVSLAITLVLALTISTSHAWHWPIAKTFTNIHLSWGLIGWVGVLVVGISFEVVPMFQMTPPYPAWIRRWLPKAIFTCLLLWSGSLVAFSADSVVTGILSLSVAGCLALFALITLNLQRHRRRRTPDTSVQFWRIGLISILLSVALWLLAWPWPHLGEQIHYELLLGILLIAGFAVSVINGMLYKIVPFLVWFHTQSLGIGLGLVPNMNEIIPDRRKRYHLYGHLSATVLLLSAVFWSWLVYPAALLFLLSFAFLWKNLYTALRVYRKACQAQAAE